MKKSQSCPNFFSQSLPKAPHNFMKKIGSTPTIKIPHALPPLDLPVLYNHIMETTTENVQVDKRYSSSLNNSFLPTFTFPSNDKVIADIVLDSDQITECPKTNDPDTSDPKKSEVYTSELELNEPKTNELKTSEAYTSEVYTSELKTSELKTSEPNTSVPKTIKRKQTSLLTKALHHLEISAVFKAPLHHVGMCMIENERTSYTEVDSVYDLLGETKNKGLVECLITPCEVDEPLIDKFQTETMSRNIHYLANENRVGELLARIRRSRRNSKLNMMS